ncbi:MAG: hypothetical protein JWP52_3784 [Rhizobacter sp.]|nr:hypothetical protein [Rhizobacter sp.]
MPLNRFSLATLPITPWKNGGGSTREIVSWPEGAADFEWRFSIATIDSSGPFSSFPDIERTIVLLDGGGVQLRSDDGKIDHRLDRPLRPFRFDGALPLQATLLDGASTDFNVMTRRALVRAQVELASAVSALPPMDRGLLYAAKGSWAIDACGPLAQGEGVWWDGTAQSMRAVPTSPGSALLVVRLKAAA